MNSTTLLLLIPFLPLLGAGVNGFFGRKLPRTAVGIVGCVGPFLSFVCSCLVFAELRGGTHLIVTRPFEWFAAGELHVAFGLAADPLAAVMILVVTGVGSLIHLYSIGYMKDDPGIARFFAYLNLFMFAMLVLVLGDNLAMMFLGWEGVGLCSYLLIGFWYEDLKNADAGKKAFVVNRIGDFGFLLGIFLLFQLGGSLDFGQLRAKAAAWPAAALTVPALLLFLGACGKSAQIPLFVWLPDAMAGPTPVSALIHAATMVTAGVYMIGRLNFVFAAAHPAMAVIVMVAAATALLGAVIACAQNDIKKILAYSTISQLGFMFAGMATAQFQTGMFHVVTHAFFKALLFLGAGAIIHAYHGEQDIRKMGGLVKKLPVLAACFIIGGLALSGLPMSSGFVSKDAILAAVYERPGFEFAWMMLLVTALLTAFYTTRLIVIVFLAPPREEEHAAEGHGEEAPAAPHELHKPGWIMLGPLVALAIPSLIGGLVLQSPFEHFLAPVWGHAAGAHGDAAAHEHAHHLNAWVSMVLFLAGFLAAFWLYGRGFERLKAFVAGAAVQKVHRFIADKLRIDECYDVVIVRPLKLTAASLWFLVDRLLIDKLFVDGTGKGVARIGGGVRRLHTGSISAALGAVVVGTVLVVRFGEVSKVAGAIWTWLVG